MATTPSPDPQRYSEVHMLRRNPMNKATAASARKKSHRLGWGWIGAVPCALVFIACLWTRFERPLLIGLLVFLFLGAVVFLVQQWREWRDTSRYQQVMHRERLRNLARWIDDNSQAQKEAIFQGHSEIAARYAQKLTEDKLEWKRLTGEDWQG